MCQTNRLFQASASDPVRFLRTVTTTLVAVAALTVPTSASALTLEQVGSFDRPTYVTSDPSDPDRLFVVEHAGRIQLIENGHITEFLAIEDIVLSADDGGHAHQGLLSMAFAPEAASSGIFYVFYTGIDDPGTLEDESGNLHIDEFSSSGDSATLATRREVLEIPDPPGVDHHGGQLQFGPDGNLYASTGDGSCCGDPSDNAQDVGSLFGKILRIDPEGSGDGDYTVPADNPFAATTGCADGCDELWSYGLRNPWRFSFDRETGALVIADVGQDAWEEIDFEPGPAAGRGDNFGWDCREGAHDYTGPEAPGPGSPSPECPSRVGTFTEPVFEYSQDVGGCSITGGYVVRDHALDDLYGRYLYADFCRGRLRSLELGVPAASDDRFEGATVARVTSFGEDADGRLYVASADGPVYRLTEPIPPPEDGTPPPEDGTPPPQDGTPPPQDGTPPPEDGMRPPGDGTPMTLELGAKKQELKKKLKFFATATAESTLSARGRVIKKTTKELAANQKTKLKARLKRKKKKKLAKRLDRKGKAKVKVKATASHESGTEATDKVKVKLKD